jgi:glycosyltransferase involved in cell wall biosynthesis
MFSPPKVRVIPFQPHCFAFGGFDLQMIAAMESARAAGADVAPLDFWRREADFDVLHCWGFEVQHANTVKWARAGGKKVVLSALVNYPGWRSWLRHMASMTAGPARLRKAMLPAIDCITVVNKARARYLIGTVGFPAQKVAVIPNSVEDMFFATAVGAQSARFEIDNYVICVGNICRRKNQLSLLRACLKLGVPLLLVGSVMTGEEDYGLAVAKAMADCKSLHWIHGMSPGSPELAQAYRGAAVFALPSYDEQQPISALEAAAMRKPLVLGDLPYARQEYYERAALADPRSVNAVAGAIRRALDNPGAHCPPSSAIEQCRKEKVGAAYMAIYRRLIQSTASAQTRRLK